MPFHTLVGHNESVHRALETLFRTCLLRVRSRDLPRRRLLQGIRAATTALRAHHAYEEEVLLPRLREEEVDGPWQRVETEHVALRDHLDVLDAAPEDGPADGSDLEPALEAIVDLLPGHFALEEAELTEAFWRELFTEEQARAFGKEVAAHNRAGLQPEARLLPLLLYNLDEAQRAVFTDRMPGFVVHGLVPVAFRPAWRHLRPFMAHPPARWTPRALRGLRG
jgi:hemerythrin-like domain-containing protein